MTIQKANYYSKNDLENTAALKMLPPMRSNLVAVSGNQ